MTPALRFEPNRTPEWRPVLFFWVGVLCGVTLPTLFMRLVVR